MEQHRRNEYLRAVANAALEYRDIELKLRDVLAGCDIENREHRFNEVVDMSAEMFGVLISLSARFGVAGKEIIEDVGKWVNLLDYLGTGEESE